MTNIYLSIDVKSNPYLNKIKFKSIIFCVGLIGSCKLNRLLVHPQFFRLMYIRYYIFICRKNISNHLNYICSFNLNEMVWLFLNYSILPLVVIWTVHNFLIQIKELVSHDLNLCMLICIPWSRQFFNGEREGGMQQIWDGVCLEATSEGFWTWA